MKRKLFNKITATAMSLFACATCLGVATLSNVDGLAEDNANVTLGYTLTARTHNSGASGLAGDVHAEEVCYPDKGLTGIELMSNMTYSNTTTDTNYTPVGGYGIHYQQSLTLKVDDVIDMSEPVEFYFSPYISTYHESHRFVMGVSDDPKTEVAPKVGGWAKRGFNASSDANYIYWDMALNTRWNVDEINQAVGPAFQTIYSNEAMNTNKEDYSLNSISSYKSSARLGGGILARAFYGATYNNKTNTPLIKATIEFTEETMILCLEDVYAEDITKCACGGTHDLTVDTGMDTGAKCYYRQTMNLEDIGFTYGESKLNLYFGYYNAYAENSSAAAQANGTLPMSLKLYNYKNGEFKNFGVKAGKEEMSITANDEIVLADVMDIQYFDGVATPTATISYASSNEAIATIVDGKVVPTANTFGGEVTITATASTGETASFKVIVDANTVTLNGEVIAAGDTYTILEGLYAGNKVLVGYMMDGELYAVGDTITLTKDVVLEEVTIDFTMLYGASVRLDATASIRFTAIINTADFAALETLVGANNVSYGMMLAAAGKTYDINSKNDNFKTSTYENSYTLYSAVMKGIPEADYTTELIAQAYLKVTYADGDEATISSLLADKKAGDVKESNVRSLADVATAAYNDRQATEGGLYLYEISEGSYSPYTAEQLAELVKYIPAN